MMFFRKKQKQKINDIFDQAFAAIERDRAAWDEVIFKKGKGVPTEIMKEISEALSQNADAYQMFCEKVRHKILEEL